MWSFLTPVVLLAMAGGFIGSLRAYTHAKDKATTAQALVNVLVGMLLAAVLGERFAPQQAPLTALFIGLMAGALGARVIDALDALVPTAVRALMLGWLQKAGGVTPAQEQGQAAAPPADEPQVGPYKE